MRKYALRLLVSLLLVSPVFIGGTTQDCFADIHWEWDGQPTNLNPPELVGKGSSFLALSIGIVSTAPGCQQFYSVNSSSWTLVGDGNPFTINGLNNGFTLDLQLKVGSVTLELGGTHAKGGGVGSLADAKLMLDPDDPAFLTIKWDSNLDGEINKLDLAKTTVQLGPAVPIPPSALLLGSGLLGLIGFRLRGQRQSTIS